MWRHLLDNETARFLIACSGRVSLVSRQIQVEIARGCGVLGAALLGLLMLPDPDVSGQRRVVVESRVAATTS